MQLNYGDSEYSHSWIEYDLGPLKCSGKEYFYPSEIKSASFKFKIWMRHNTVPANMQNIKTSVTWSFI